MMEPADRVTSGVSEQPEARSRENLPLYLDLPKELRDRIPRLAMSMHYYSSDPGRRLVRINDRLLHEGDWLSSELHVVEITATGAILDFQGKSFVMRSPIR
jgi:general secretion pathway protein B